MTTRSLKVEIAGIGMSVKTDASEEDVRRLAQMVERRLRELGQSGTATPTPQQILLTALTLADDYQKSRRELDELRATLEHELAELRAALAQAEGEGADAQEGQEDA